MSLRLCVTCLFILLGGCSNEKQTVEFTNEMYSVDFDTYGSVRGKNDRYLFKFPQDSNARQIPDFDHTLEVGELSTSMLVPYTINRGKWKVVMVGMNQPASLTNAVQPHLLENVYVLKEGHKYLQSRCIQEPCTKRTVAYLQQELLEHTRLFLEANNLRDKFEIHYVRLDNLGFTAMEPNDKSPFYPIKSDDVDVYAWITPPKKDFRYIQWWIANEQMSDLPLVRKYLKEDIPFELHLPSIFILNEENEIFAEISAHRMQPISAFSKYENKEVAFSKSGYLEEYIIALNLVKIFDLNYVESMTNWKNAVYSSEMKCLPRVVDSGGDCMKLEIINSGNGFPMPIYHQLSTEHLGKFSAP